MTFRRPEQKDLFSRRNFISIHDQHLALQDVDRPLTFVQVFDAPHELPDTALISRLSKFCEVVSNRRGYFREPGWENVQDGVRHFRVCLQTPIPSFLRFGKFLVHVRYNGQVRTCRHCHQTGHLANTCGNQCCFNCDEIGHLASNCPKPVMCHLCKSPDHRANTCSFSWAREVPATPPHGSATDNTTIDNTTNDEPLNDETNDDDYLTDDVFAENDDEDEDESLHGIPDEAFFVAAPGVSLDEMNDDDSPTNDDLNDVANPPEVEDSPSLFSVDTTEQDSISNSQAVKSTMPHSGCKPAKIMEMNIPLRNPTQPTLVSGKKTEKKGDNTGMSDQETSPKKNRPGPRKKKRK